MSSRCNDSSNNHSIHENINMSNLFIESLERFKRHRHARGEFGDEEHLKEPNVDEIEAGYRRAFKNRKVYNRENYRDSC
jgi:hypothetical protein